MKKLFLFFMCFMIGMVMAQAQSETLTVKAVKKGEEPKEVMDAIKQDFPKAIVGDLSVLPAKLYGEQWSVNLQDNMNGATPAFYHVSIKDGNEIFKAVYDKSGKMISSKTVIKNEELPKEITATIAAKYPGWSIIYDSEKITYKEGKVKEVISAQIKKDTMYRLLFIDSGGTLIKDVLLKSSK